MIVGVVVGSGLAVWVTVEGRVINTILVAVLVGGNTVGLRVTVGDGNGVED